LADDTVSRAIQVLTAPAVLAVVNDAVELFVAQVHTALKAVGELRGDPVLASSGIGLGAEGRADLVAVAEPPVIASAIVRGAGAHLIPRTRLVLRAGSAVITVRTLREWVQPARQSIRTDRHKARWNPQEVRAGLTRRVAFACVGVLQNHLLALVAIPRRAQDSVVGYAKGSRHAPRIVRRKPRDTELCSVAEQPILTTLVAELFETPTVAVALAKNTAKT
jgi:hypothetical protein